MKKYFTLIALALTLAGVTLNLFKTTDGKLSEGTGDKFYKVLFLGKDLQHLVEEENSNWKYLVKFEYAAKTSTKALSTYSNLINDNDLPAILRELAQYLEVMSLLHLNGEKINKDKIKNLESSIVYPYSSQEAIAIAKINNDDVQDAIQILRSLSNDKKCPTLIRANAQELLKIYGT